MMQGIGKILKVQAFVWIFAVVLLMILSFLMYLFDLSEGWIRFGILLIYALSCIAGGWMAGHICPGRRFLNGLVQGSLFFLVLFLISMLFQSAGIENIGNVITCIAICCGSGILGALLIRKCRS